MVKRRCQPRINACALGAPLVRSMASPRSFTFSSSGCAARSAALMVRRREGGGGGPGSVGGAMGVTATLSASSRRAAKHAAHMACTRAVSVRTSCSVMGAAGAHASGDDEPVSVPAPGSGLEVAIQPCGRNARCTSGQACQESDVRDVKVTTAHIMVMACVQKHKLRLPHPAICSHGHRVEGRRWCWLPRSYRLCSGTYSLCYHRSTRLPQARR